MPARNGSRIFRITSAGLYARPRAFVRRERRRRGLLLRVVGAAHFDDLGAEGLEHLLHDGIRLGALAHEPLLAPRLVLGVRCFVPGVSRRPHLDADADAATQNVAADLAQEFLILGLPPCVAEVLRFEAGP